MTRFLSALSGAAALAVLASPAFAGVDMTAVAAIAAEPIATGIGANTTEIERRADGITVVKVSLPVDFKYVVVNDLCNAAGACDRLGFIAVFSPSAGDFSPETINQWNALRPPQAFRMADGGTAIVHYVMVRGGLPADTLRQNVEFWNNTIIAFDNFLSNAPSSVAVNAVSVSAAAPTPSHSLLPPAFAHQAIEANMVNGKLLLPD